MVNDNWNYVGRYVLEASNFKITTSLKPHLLLPILPQYNSNR